MGQTHLNWCVLLRAHHDETDALDLKQIANKFVARIHGQYNISEILLLCTLHHKFLRNTNLMLSTKV